MDEKLLELRNINRTVRNKKGLEQVILDDVNLDIYKNQALCLIGPTGSGKTSILRIINLIDKPDSGTIYYKSQKVNFNDIKFRRNIAMVFQKPIVLRGTVFDNMYFGLKIRGYSEEDCVDEINKYLKLVNLDGYSDHNAGKLSGGETQKLALARALILKPKILLLDEPTANLDPNSKSEIENIIEDIKNNSDITIILATHDLIQGHRLCDKLAIINKTVIQVGESEEIFEKPKNEFVANFLGIKNIEFGKISYRDEDFVKISVKDVEILSSDIPDDDNVKFSIRPDEIFVLNENAVSPSEFDELNKSNEYNIFKGDILEIEDKNSLIELKIDIGIVLQVHILRSSLDNLNVNEKVFVKFKRDVVNIF